MPRRFCTGPQSSTGPSRHAAAVALPPQPAVARHLDLERIRQRVDHRDADAVQPARGPVGVAAELAARMQHRQDDLERRFVGKARMRIDRNAAAVVAHRDPALGGRAPIRCGWQSRPPPRPSRCRAPRRRGDAAPARRCRRHTCRGGGAPAPGLRGPRCPSPNSCRRRAAAPDVSKRSAMAANYRGLATRRKQDAV